MPPVPAKKPTTRPAAVPVGGDSLRLAAVDVGSNSIHMVVAQVDPDGGVTTLWRMKEPVGLGRGSFPSRRLTRETMDRAVATLGRFQQAARQRGAEKIVAVATSAVREARNGGDLIERVRRELKLRVKVVTAKEEARLIYLGVRHAMPLGETAHLVVDIGGGSVEFVVGDDEAAALLESRKLGAARTTARFVKSDPISKDDLAAMRAHFARELGPLVEDIESLEPAEVIGTSGTLENLAAMANDGAPALDADGRPVIAAKQFDKLLRTLVKSTGKDREQIRGLDSGRRDQIVAGAALVGELFERLKMKRIVLCGSALREGILFDYLARKVPQMEVRREVPDPRRRAVIDLARRCRWHRDHSQQVARLTLRLFDETKGLHGLGDGPRELIEYAALLHDVGWHIGGKGHHKHSQYLIEHGKLDRHFSPDEVAVMANVARYHRRAEPKAKHKSYAEAVGTTAAGGRRRRVAAPPGRRAGPQPRRRGRRRGVPRRRADGQVRAQDPLRRRAGGVGRRPQARPVRAHVRPQGRVRGVSPSGQIGVAADQRAAVRGYPRRRRPTDSVGAIGYNAAMSTAVAPPPPTRPKPKKSARRAPAPPPSSPPARWRTAADWWESLGRVPLERIIFAPTPGTATAEDVLRLNGEGYKFVELVNGTLVEKTLGYFESLLAISIATELRIWAKPQRRGAVSGPDGTLRLRLGNIRIPDVAFVRREDLPEGGARRDDPIPELVPTLIVEVVSASNTAQEIADRLRDHFANGTRLAWVFDPAGRTVRVHDSPDAPDRFRQLTAADTLDGGDALPGFAANVGELFEV